MLQFLYNIVKTKGKMENFKNYIFPDKLEGKYRIAYVIGVIILFADMAWWVTWISFGARSLNNKNVNDGTAFFNALASPHTALIPTMFSILNDLYANCNTANCQVTTPPFTWYIFPSLMIPYDAISFAYNKLVYGKKYWTYGLSIYTIAMSSSTAIWSFTCYFLIVWKPPKKEQREQNETIETPLLSHMGTRRRIYI